MALEILCSVSMGCVMLATPSLSVVCPEMGMDKLDRMLCRMLLSFALPNFTLQSVFSNIHCISWILFVCFYETFSEHSWKSMTRDFFLLLKRWCYVLMFLC
jgi:hypothetical protein